MADNSQSEEIARKIRALLSQLSAEERERVVHSIARTISPTPRAGDILRAIVKFLPRQTEWTVNNVAENVASAGVEASKREIYNALSYLVRRGYVQRVSYGRYLVSGVLIETSDDLGVEPDRRDYD